MNLSNYPNIKNKISSLKTPGAISFYLSLLCRTFLGIFFVSIGLGIIINSFANHTPLRSLTSFMLFIPGYLFLTPLILCLKTRKKYDATISSLSSQEIEQLSAECLNATDLNSFCITQNFIICRTVHGPYILRNCDIIWIYGTNTEHRMNGFYNGNTFGIMCGTKQQIKYPLYSINGDRDSYVEPAKVMDIIARKLVQFNIRYGYSKQLDKFFKKDLQSFYSYDPTKPVNTPKGL